MAEFNFAVQGERRKALVAAMSEVLNQPVKYLGAPGFQYEVGSYSVSKTGLVTGEYDLNLFVGLAERGFETKSSPILTAEPAAEIIQEQKPVQFKTPRGTFAIEKIFPTSAHAEADGYGIYFTHDAHDVYIKPNPYGATEHSMLFALVGEPLPEREELITDDPNKMTVEVPNDFTSQQIDNLAMMVAAKEPLLLKSLGAEHLPIRVTEEKVMFPWFTLSDPADAAYYVQFVCALCETVKEKKRVTAKAPDSGFENEKFAMRVWLVGLGLSGKEYKNCRALLMRGLSGDAAWRYAKPKRKETESEATEVSTHTADESEVQSNE